MRRLFMLAAGLAVILLGACTSDSSLPLASGKASLRAINAIPGSPEIAFLIEERVIAGVSYKNSSGATRYDDLVYTFNFEALFAGETSPRRIASQNLDVIAEKDYTFVITGALAAPTITLWEGDERTWDGGETVFQAQFGHTATSLGDIDVYFAAPGTAPVLGEQRGTLSFGEVLPPADIAEGDYVLTLTAAGDPASVVYTSNALTFGAQSAVNVIAFDGDGNDTAPIVVRSFSAAGASSSAPDVNSPPTLRFINASTALGTADIYDDPALVTPIVTSHAFGDATGDLDAAVGDTPLTYTAAGNSGAILYEDDASLVAGTHNHYIVVGGAVEDLANVQFVPDRRSIQTFAKLLFMHAAANHATVDVYVGDAGAEFSDAVLRLFAVGFGISPFGISLDAGSYDLFVTPTGEQTILTGPVRVDVALGDIVDALLLDTVDPATAQIQFIPVP